MIFLLSLTTIYNIINLESRDKSLSQKINSMIGIEKVKPYIKMKNNFNN